MLLKRLTGSFVTGFRAGAIVRFIASSVHAGRLQTRSGLVYHRSMVIRNISQAKAELSALIAEVLNGNEVILEKAGKPVAKLVPYRGAAGPRVPGSMAGDICVAPDFDTLPDDIADAFGMAEPQLRIPGHVDRHSELMSIMDSEVVSISIPI
jgi:prevent-host-death family protein